jgi:hypothetical protein
MALTIGMFVLGVVAHKHHYIPTAFRDADLQLRAWSVSPEAVLSGQYSQDRERLPPVRNLDTALLPLRIRRTRLSDVLPAPKVGGAITAMGNTVIVMDRLGNLYASSSNGQTLTHLPFPPLPNAATEYVRTPGARIDENTFRAYDILYVESAQLFVVAHESFDAHIGKTRLAVSVIDIDEHTIRPTGPCISDRQKRRRFAHRRQPHA